MFRAAKQEFGDVDVVCPGAGVYEPVSGSALFLTVESAKPKVRQMGQH